MAQGEFTKQEAQETIDSVKEILETLSRRKQAEFLGHFNDIFLFLEAAKKNAPDENEA